MNEEQITDPEGDDGLPHEEEQPIESPPPDDADVREAEQEAAAEAARVGGETDLTGIDAADRAEAERAAAGGGVAEGFEQAEQQLVEEATTDHTDGDPVRDAGEPEANPNPATYGEADQEKSSEDEPE